MVMEEWRGIVACRRCSPKQRRRMPLTLRGWRQVCARRYGRRRTEPSPFERREGAFFAASRADMPPFFVRVSYVKPAARQDDESPAIFSRVRRPHAVVRCSSTTLFLYAAHDATRHYTSDDEEMVSNEYANYPSAEMIAAR